MRFLLLSLLFFNAFILSANDSTPKKVFVMEIRDGIDARMSRYVSLALEEAKAQAVDYVIIDMDTYGGGVKEADDIRTALLDFTIPLYVFINDNAGSAGALISIACDSIYMSGGASFGASTVVNQEGEVVPEKYQSFMRSKMRATAEAKGRDPKIAEAMVGLNLHTKDSARVISFTTQEAIDNNYCEGKRESIKEIMEKNGVTDFELIRYQLSSTEQFIALFLNPALKSILILVILGGLYFELQSPGVGFPLLASITALLLYFIPDYLHGMLAYWEVGIFVIGVVLIALEVFVIPGFGVAGISGIILVFTSLVLSMVGNDNFDFTFVPSGDLKNAFLVLFISIIITTVFVFLTAGTLVRTAAFKRLTVTSSMDEKVMGDETAQLATLVGQEGTTATRLNPTGRVKIGDDSYDARSTGEFVDKDQLVKVVSVHGFELKVKRIA